jgi:membrane protein
VAKSIDAERAAREESDRGRVATRPPEVPHKGWWDVIWRVIDQTGADNVSIVAGGLALFGLLSVFPTLAAAVAICGLIGSPEAIAAQAQPYSELLPAGVLSIVENQLSDLAVQQRDTFGRTYGAIAGVIVMLMWFYVSAFVIILGAEMNSELERQTVRDTTEGEPKPLGERGAFSADTVRPRARS